MIKEKTVKFAQEVDDVMVLLVEAIKVGKSGASVTNLMDEFVKAVSGIDQVDDEYEANRLAVMQTVGMRFGDVVDAFLPAQVKPVPAP